MPTGTENTESLSSHDAPAAETAGRPQQTLVISLAEGETAARVSRFYRDFGFSPATGPGDDLFFAELNGGLVGAVRVVEERDIFVLRALCVSEAARKQGIGAKLLARAAAHIGNRLSWCIAPTSLRALFAGIGFLPIDEAAAPEHLRCRLADYRAAGRTVQIFRRPATLP